MTEAMYQSAFGRFGTMDKRVRDIMESGGTIPVERYVIMDSMMDSMNPMKMSISTQVMNDMVDNFNIISEKEIKSKMNSNVNKMMLDLLTKELNNMLTNSVFDIAVQREKVTCLMDEIKRLNMMT